MDNTKKYLTLGLTLARSILLFFLFIYSVGFLTASLLYDGVRTLADQGAFDPFNADGSTFTWLNVSIWLFALGVTILSFLLYRQFLKLIAAHPFRNTYRVVTIILLFGIGFVANVAAWVSVGKLNLSEARLAKVVALYGPKEDLCQVLKLGLTQHEMVGIMGLPAGKSELLACKEEPGCAVTYCPQSGDCRDVTLNHELKIIKIECWTGKAIGLPI